MRSTALFSLLAVVALLPAPARAAGVTRGAGDLPPYDASDASAAPVDAGNLLANERFWPWQVALVRSWTTAQPARRTEPLPVGSTGVLIRVEGSGRVARVDFGRDGLYEVPVAATDLVERAERIRRGELDKSAPNFVVALGPRLLEPGSATPHPFPYPRTLGQRGFLTVFADPGSDGFAALAKALAPLADRPGVLTMLLPQGGQPSARVAGRLRLLDWKVPFVFDYLTGPYTRTLLPEDLAAPAVMLQTAEGRVLFQSRWRDGVVPELVAALDRAFPKESAKREP